MAAEFELGGFCTINRLASVFKYLYTKIRRNELNLIGLGCPNLL